MSSIKVSKVLAIVFIAVVMTALTYFVPQKVMSQQTFSAPTNSTGELESSSTSYYNRGYPFAFETSSQPESVAFSSECGPSADCLSSMPKQFFIQTLVIDFVIWLIIVVIIAFLTANPLRRGKKK